AQADTSAPPASAPLDTSPPPAAATDAAPGNPGDATTQAPGTPGSTAPGGAATPPANPLSGLLFPMILIIGLLFIFTMGSGRKEKKRKAELMANLSKGAKVQTVGGILGTIVEVRDDEVVVKVDESSNTRMRFSKSAISSATSEH
ncbi:MAG: preprotein translocase subunit YajC, partial [Planctomycetota bacterium]